MGVWTRSFAVLWFVVWGAVGCEDTPRYSATSVSEPESSSEPDGIEEEDDPAPEIVQPEPPPEPGPLYCVDDFCACADGQMYPCGGCFASEEEAETADICNCDLICSEVPPPPEPVTEPEPIPDEIICFDPEVCVCDNGQEETCSLCFPANENPPPDFVCDCDALCDNDLACDGPGLECSRTCQFGLLPDSFGCATCGCDARLLLRAGEAPEVETEDLRLEITPSTFIGGINRVLFDLKWTFDNPLLADEAFVLQTSVAWMQISPWDQPTNEWVTFSFLSSGPLEFRGGLFQSFGFGVVEVSLDIVDGFMTFRIENDTLHGRVWMVVRDVERNSTPGSWEVGASFEIPNPFTSP